MSTADEATRTVPQPKAVVVPAPSKKKKAAVMLPTADEVEALVVLMVAFFIAKGDAGKANPIKLRVLLGTHAGKERTLLEKIAADQNGGDGPVEDAATRASAWWLSQGGDAGRKRKRASDATKAAPREMVAPAALPSFAPGAEPLAPSASMFFFGATHEGEEAAPHPVAVGAASAFAAAASLTGLDELRRKLPHGSAGRIVNSFVIPWHPDAILHQRGLHVAMQADRHDSLCSIWDEQRGAGYSFVRFCDPRLGRLSSRLDGYEHSLDDDPPDDPDDGHAYLTRCCFCNDPVQVHCEFGPKWVKIGDGGKGDLKHPLHITDPDKIFCWEFGTPMGWYLRLDGADCDRQLDDREDEDAVCDTCGMDSAFLCCDFCTPDLPGVYRCYECRMTAMSHLQAALQLQESSDTAAIPLLRVQEVLLRLQAASPLQSLFDAAAEDNIEGIRVLRAVDVDLFGIRSTSGLNCLMFAARRGSPRVLQFCLDNGGDANDDDTHGGTALTAAACYAHTECARILIAAGADVAYAYSGDNATIVYMMCLVFSHLSSVEEPGQYAETLTLLLASGAPRDTLTAPDLMAMVSFEWMGGGDTGRGKNALSLLVAEPEGGVESKDASWISERASLRALLAPSSSALAALLAAQEGRDEEESDDGRMPLTYDADGMLDASQMADEQKEQLGAILDSMC